MTPGSLAETDVWTKLSAVGALAASLVALGIASIPPLWRHFLHRPKLKLRTGAVEPWAKVINLANSKPYEVWLRAQVTNLGRAEARNVRAVVQAWYERHDSKQWVRRDLDPAALHWVSMQTAVRLVPGRPPVFQRETAPVVSLPPDLSDFVDLVRYTPNTGKHHLVLDDPSPKGFYLQPNQATGEFIITVTLVAENASTLTKHVYYQVSQKDLFVDVHCLKEPPADARYFGLLGMTKMVAGNANADSNPSAGGIEEVSP